MRLAAFVLAFASVVCVPVLASPWAEVGDNQLRGDVELLQAAGVISTVTIHWPLPWKSLTAQLEARNLNRAPADVRAAAARLLARAHQETADGFRASAYADVTNRASVIYGFDGMGRGDGQAQLSLSGTSGAFSGRLSAGLISNDFGAKPNKLMLDGTYVAADVWGARVYAGYLDHWWGPGAISALSLSNNARPMPQIGIERSSTQASSWPVLNWLGPWQMEFMLGYLDGPRLQPNTYYNGLRVSFQPLPGLEIGLARTEEFCGRGHPCSPIRDYFDFNNDPTDVNKTNDEGVIDIKYSHTLGGVPFQIYTQVMNEDSSPITHSGSTHLFGVGVWLPTNGNPVKLTAEYTDSISTKDIFSFGDNLYGFSYTNGTYFDGMRYRGRTLGFSLDDDSTLASLQGSWTDNAGRFYEITLHHATIGSAHSIGSNILSPTPVTLNMADARVSLPLDFGGTAMHLDLAGRLQDDQPRPHQGFVAAIEAAIRVGL